MRMTVAHEHEGDALTIGCRGCIERVKLDQLVQAFVEWFQTCEWDEPELPTDRPTRQRIVAVYHELRGLGYERYDVRSVLGLWQVEWTDPAGHPAWTEQTLL